MTTLAAAARTVLLTADAHAKAHASRAMAAAWGAGAVDWAFDVPMPDVPARPDKPELLPPNRMRKRGRAGSERTRIALLHAVAHIELNAIDLAWDMAGRFSGEFPRAFADDWVRVADDEARHFLLVAGRLADLGAAYGDLPAHDGLWQAAQATAHDARARLAVVPQVLEARGLDVTPAMQARFAAASDSKSAEILGIIYRDEIEHVRIGNHWFRSACDSNGSPPAAAFRTLVGTYFRGKLKPPFNDLARGQAGMTPDFYTNLSPPASRD